MKQKLFTATLILLAFFQSCKDDDKANTPSLSGKFGMVTHEYYGCTDATKNKTVTCPATVFCRDLEFLADNKLAIHHPYPGSTHNGTYQIVQDQLVMQITDYNYSLLYTIAVSGNTITLTRVDPGSSYNCSEKEIYTKL